MTRKAKKSRRIAAHKGRGGLVKGIDPLSNLLLLDAAESIERNRRVLADLRKRRGSLRAGVDIVALIAEERERRDAHLEALVTPKDGTKLGARKLPPAARRAVSEAKKFATAKDVLEDAVSRIGNKRLLVRLATSRAPRAHGKKRLDEQKLRLAAAVLAEYPLALIRAASLANLRRWRKDGSWVPAYDEWKRLMTRAPDRELVVTMLGRDERATELRQSPPYVGLLSADAIERHNQVLGLGAQASNRRSGDS